MIFAIARPSTADHLTQAPTLFQIDYALRGVPAIQQLRIPGKCSIFVLMPQRPDWPRPPSAIPHILLDRPPAGAVVTVAGLVLVRQRPGTAKGVIFISLEDETGVANVVVWAKTYEKFRRAVVAGRMLRNLELSGGSV